MRPIVRPFWVIGIALLAVCLIGAWLPLSWLQYGAAALTVLLSIAVLSATLRKIRIIPFAVAAVLAACLWLAYCEAVHYRPLQAYDGREVSVCATVQLRDEGVVLKTVSGDLPRGMRMWLSFIPPDTDLQENDTVQAAFVLSTSDSTGFELLQSKASGVWLWATSVEETSKNWVIEHNAPTLSGRCLSVRNTLADGIQSLLGGDTGAVVSGICLGEDRALSADSKAAFRRCGVSHLFAVSGLHLSILTAALARLLKRFHLPRRVCGVIGVVAVVGFSMLVGLTPSVTRAGILCLLVTVGDCFRRQADARNSLGLALAVLLTNNPFAAYDVGLLLSFFATFGLLFAAPLMKEYFLRLCPLRKLLPLWRFTAETVSVTLAATAATLPITVLFFGSVSLISVLSNVLMTVPASVLLVLGCVAMLLTPLPFLEFLYRPLLFLVGWLAKGLLWIAETLSAIPVSTVPVNSLYAVLWVLGSLGLLAVGWRLLRFRGVLVSAVCVMVLLAAAVPIQRALLRDTVRCYVLSEQDLAVCIVREDTAVLITAPTDINTLYKAQAFLERQGCNTLEAVCVPQSSSQLLAYIPLIFEDHLQPNAVFRPSTAAVELESIGRAVWEDTQLLLTVDGCLLSFNATDVFADCAFTAEAVTVYRGDEPYVLYEQNGRSPTVWIQSGELLIK